MLAPLLSPNIKFKNSPKILKATFQKYVPQFFLYWHINHVCQDSYESEKNCRGSSDLKKSDDT